MFSVRIRRLQSTDIPGGLRLREQAGWNQTSADWHRFLALQPAGCFVAERSGEIVGTVTTCVFGSVGWIGMLLVDRAARRRGVGRALLDAALAYLQHEGTSSVRLDATPLGEPLYRRLGFEPQYRLVRFGGQVEPATVVHEMSGPARGPHLSFLPFGHPSRAEGSEVTDSTPCLAPSSDRLPADRPSSRPARDRADILSLDRHVIGYDRRRLIERLLREPAGWGLICRDTAGDGVAGFALVRPGRLAVHVGPCVVAASRFGSACLLGILRRLARQPVVVDVPEVNAEAGACLRQCGLQPGRQLLRMCRGQQVIESLDGLWASSGPEKG
jgi:GNAT superfamily N-acetyltransferase